ncbi:isochorismatase family cysteine hydrolase [Actinocorallia sp. A-T 12471]|uniref:cysteine hydrolase family protein n=1 Tax=Actinocorallia sp. A-T 12471 TaxID=3089813 RepID=UPI0029CC1A55|nr:isochorismatase family cysteine hydrolase [Actinocorallia sp. A-T 12471]MDX6740811.1 isochorismatase family cysteine hydrolase [Actinocorallia sp. A-T 12471]
MGTTALLVIDMFNPYRHEDAEVLQGSVAGIVEPLAGLLGRARESDDAFIVYVNDNLGDFTASRDELVERALKGERPDLVEPLVPGQDCDFLTKIRHSAFYGTPLEYLLGRKEVDEVLLTGQVTEQCVLYTALDAYIRHLSVSVVTDAVAAIDPELGEAALRMMRRNMRAELVTAQDCFG